MIPPRSPKEVIDSILRNLEMAKEASLASMHKIKLQGSMERSAFLGSYMALEQAQSLIRHEATDILKEQA